MDFKDYYATLGVPSGASQDEIKRAWRKLARKYHPDLSREPDAEARFKDATEAHEALIDPERRAAYDDLVRHRAQRQAMGDAGGWPDDAGYEFSGRGGGGGRPGSDAGFSAFFESMFGRAGRSSGGTDRGAHSRARSRGVPEGVGPGDHGNPFEDFDGFAADDGPRQGADHHARMAIDLEDAYRGAAHTLTLQRPVVSADGHVVMVEHRIEVKVPRGLRAGQQLRLAGQGGEGDHGGKAGDLYIEIAWRPHPRFRVDGQDVTVDLLLAPWEAALGTELALAGPDRSVTLTVPPGATAGSRLRLKGEGVPGKSAGDLYVLLAVMLPPADNDAARAAYAAFAQAFPAFNPREPR